MTIPAETFGMTALLAATGGSGRNPGGIRGPNPGGTRRNLAIATSWHPGVMALSDPMQSSRGCHPHCVPDLHAVRNIVCRMALGRVAESGCGNRAQAGFVRSAARGRHALTIHLCNVLPGGLARLIAWHAGVYPVRQAATWRMSSVISVATLTTSPTTTIAGGRTPFSATRLSTCSSVELIVC